MSDEPRPLLRMLNPFGSASAADSGVHSARGHDDEPRARGGNWLAVDGDWAPDDSGSGPFDDSAEDFGPIEPSFAAFLEDARHGLDALVASEPGTPDFAATVRLAHVLDPMVVPESWVERAELEANVVPLRRRSTSDADALAPFVAALREAVDGAAWDRRMSGIPPLGERVEEATRALPTRVHGSDSGRRSPRTAGSIARFAAVAAIVAFAAFAGLSGLVDVGLARTEAPLASRADVLRIEQAAVDGAMARMEARPAPVDGVASVAPMLDLGDPNGAPIIDEQASGRDSEAALASDAVEPPSSALIDETRPPARAVSRPRTSSSAMVAGEEQQAAPLVDDVESMTLDERLSQLETAASTAWREGQLESASDSLEQLIKIGGTHRRVEAAFADRFAITRQQLSGPRREAALVDLWSRYLERFPRGRHADDARAGLCRLANGDERAACWTSYVTHHPEGEHVDDARAWIAEHGGNLP